MIKNILVGMVKFLLCLIIHLSCMIIAVVLLVPFIVSFSIAVLADFGSNGSDYKEKVGEWFWNKVEPLTDLEDRIIKFKI